MGQISGIMRKLVHWKSNKIGLFCCHIAKVIAFGTEMTHGQIKLTSEKTLLPFLGLEFFSLGLGFFFRKERRHLGIQGCLSLLRKVLFGEFYISSGIIRVRHYQAYYTHTHTHVHYDKPPYK